MVDGIPCADCRTVGPAGRRCPNPRCAPPSCPGCGVTPWHDRAICHDLLDGKKVVTKGCGHRGPDLGYTPRDTDP